MALRSYDQIPAFTTLSVCPAPKKGIDCKKIKLPKKKYFSYPLHFFLLPKKNCLTPQQKKIVLHPKKFLEPYKKKKKIIILTPPPPNFCGEPSLKKYIDLKHRKKMSLAFFKSPFSGIRCYPNPFLTPISFHLPFLSVFYSVYNVCIILEQK